MANTTTSTGSSGSDTLYASDSGSKISAGARDDTLVGGTQDVYTGGSGVDTVMIEFTLAQWLDAANQQQITDYLAHLVKVTNPETDQARMAWPAMNSSASTSKSSPSPSPAPTTRR